MSDNCVNGTDATKRWLSYRPEIKVLDCTIRDGGLMNNHLFSDEVTKAVYKSNVEGGVDYMEFGYMNSADMFSRDEYGPWKFCAEEDLRRIVGNNDTDLKISVMADAERCNLERDLLNRNDSVVDMIRVATYIHQLPEAIEMINLSHERGYETTINLMAVSTVPGSEVEAAIKLFADTPVDVVYLADSFGSMYSEQIHSYIKMYGDCLKGSGKELGMHAHNNQQLAYANTIECIIDGVNYLDASYAGLGRGAGNCALELLLGFLHNPKYHLRPLMECIRDHIAPMQEDLKWGFDIPYMLTGQMNQHPRAAIKFNESDDRGDYLKFFDMINDED
ncbi:MAG: aldolase catalytic domain-containing protein [Planctomycetes bacterium]|nr:aldolase catalytic domain-containing protein [Planctomycetota bacterium]